MAEEVSIAGRERQTRNGLAINSSYVSKGYHLKEFMNVVELSKATSFVPSMDKGLHQIDILMVKERNIGIIFDNFNVIFVNKSPKSAVPASGHNSDT